MSARSVVTAMMTRPVSIRRPVRLPALLGLWAVVVVLGSARAQARPHYLPEAQAVPGARERHAVEVTRLQVEGRGPDLIALHVAADGPLGDYESFALPDPPRLVIDLLHARHAISQPVPVPAGSPILRVRTTQYRERPLPVVRLVFDLDQVQPYRVEVSGDRMQILIGAAASGEVPKGPERKGVVQGAGQPAEREAAPAPAEPGGLPVAPSSAGPGTAAQTGKDVGGSARDLKEDVPSLAANPVTRRAAAALRGLQVLRRGPDGATLLLVADGPLGDYESFALPDPPRLVIDLPHTRHAISHPLPVPAGSPILRVRTTQYRERPVPVVRLVFDLSRPLPHTIERIEGGVVVSIGEVPREARAPAVAETLPERHKTEEPATPRAPARPTPPSIAVGKPQGPEPKPPAPAKPAVTAEPATPPAVVEPQRAVGGVSQKPPSVANRLSLDFKGADLDDLLRLISEVSGLNVVAAHKLKPEERKVTVRLINVEWRQALDIILRTKGLSYEQDGNVIFVGSKSEIQKAKEERARDIQEAEKKRLELEEAELKLKQRVEEEQRKAEEARKKAEQEARLREIRIEEEKRKAEELQRLMAEPLVSKEVRLNYTRPADIRKRVEPYKSPRGKLDVDESLNALILEDVESVAAKIEEVARRYDFPANEPIVARTTTLHYARPADVARQLEPYKTSRGRLVPDDARNTLLIEDFQSATAKMEGLAKGFDIPANEPILTRTATLTVARAADVAKRLEPLKTPRGKLIVDDQTNSIIVEDFQSAAMKMEAFIRQLDKPEVDRFVTKLLPYNYARASDVKTHLAALKSPQGSVVVDERSSRIIVKDVPQAVERMEAFLRQIDIPTPQVLIEARIVEASRSFSQSLGVQWGGAGVPTTPGSRTGGTLFGGSASPGIIQFPSITPPPPGSPGAPFLDPTNPIPFAGPVPLALNLPALSSGASPFFLGATIGSLANRFLVGAQLSAAEREGKVRTLSAPRVATQDNEEAEIKQGTQVPFTTIDSSGRTVVSFQDAFIKLKVKPHITPDGRVSMKVEAERSFAGDRIDFSGGFAFPINTRKATTNILVPNGATVVIGGLLQSTEQITEDRVPFLGRIPILGWLFKRHSIGPEERVELLIFLTPSVLQETRT